MSSAKRIRVKVCGMTRPQDVAAAVDLGVDAIGMILHADSPRLIDVSAAQAIRAQVPAFVNLVGVFVNADVALINHAIAEIGLDLVQLHGDEDEQFANRLDAAYIKAIRAKDSATVESALSQYPLARALLLDTFVEAQHGGTGVQLDPALWPSAAPQKLILAGGLCATNVAAACATTKPYAVDLNSGVELEPGIKDVKLIAKALCAIRAI